MSTTPISTEVGTQLLFENERVRVWDLSLKPGESTGLHRHENDYFFVVIGGGTLQAVDEEGKKKSPSSMQDGEVHFRNLRTWLFTKRETWAMGPGETSSWN